MWRHRRAVAEQLPLSDSDEDLCGSRGWGVWSAGGGRGDCDLSDSDDNVDDYRAEEDAFWAAFSAREEGAFDIVEDGNAGL